MKANSPGYTPLDKAIAGEIRAELARQSPDKNISNLADSLGIRRATLSVKINGHQPFTPGLLSQVAEYLGTTASDLTAAAEERLTEQAVA